MSDFSTSCYLIVKADRRRDGSVKGVKIVATRARRPGLAEDEAAIKITMDVPASLFDAEAVAFTVKPRDAMLAVAQEPISASWSEGLR